MKKLFSALLTSIIMLAFIAAPVFALDYTNKDIIKSVQQALNNAGYDCGTPDGSAGNKTKAAITNYRAAKGLTAGDAIDDELAVSLGLIQPEAQSTADSAESIMHLESTEYGDISFVRYEVKDDTLILIYDYTNTTNDTVTPIMQYTTTGFQDGIQLDTSFIISGPEDADSGTKQIRPGAKLRYYSCLKIEGSSPVELELHPIWDIYKKNVASCVINITEESPVYETVDTELSEASDAVPTDNNSAAVQADLDAANAKIKDLESQLEEANKTIEALQEQIDTIKSALGA